MKLTSELFKHVDKAFIYAAITENYEILFFTDKPCLIGFNWVSKRSLIKPMFFGYDYTCKNWKNSLINRKAA